VNEVVLVDIDGTVAHRCDRGPYEYDKVGTDFPDSAVIEVVNCLWKSSKTIIYITGREDSCYEETYKWLVENCPPFSKLYMRKTGDYRKDSEVKKEIYENHIKDKFNVLCVLDDRQSVVDMWRDLGLKCLQVNYGDF
jgi:uncharacterized HAD superfamily protein